MVVALGLSSDGAKTDLAVTPGKSSISNKYRSRSDTRKGRDFRMFFLYLLISFLGPRTGP